jgi:hypothetical protein
MSFDAITLLIRRILFLRSFDSLLIVC